MLFTEEWLRQYCNPQLSTEELAETLTMAGLEVEEVTSVAPAFTGVVVAEVLTCRDHENSDHLHVCEVNAGTGETLQIVCGAPNVRAGIKVACATIGAVLPGDFKIKKSKLRGVVSMGMLCSVRELGISEEHNGIWILPEDAPIGTDIREYARLDDSKIEIKLTPNRGDALSVTGVARDLHAVTGAPLVMPAMDPVPATCECVKSVVIEAPDLCGRFTGRVIRNLNPAAETPQWMRDRLERAGMRHISALVDISNYVMLELGRPTHFFDLAKLEGDRITVRWAREGESLKLLNEQTEPVMRKLHERGVKCAIASSSYRELIDELVEIADIADVLDYTISGHECSAFKPDPEIYLRAMEALGVEPAECLVIEDSPLGIEAGKRSGARVLALRPHEGVNLDQSRADAVIDNLTDILAAL